jgi:regulator of extracellular matrix RemA (YlzA/DUF370 family)
MNRVIAMASPNSAPTKRAIQDRKNKELLIDMTNGRRNKVVIFTDSGHIILAIRASSGLKLEPGDEKDEP